VRPNKKEEKVQWKRVGVWAGRKEVRAQPRAWANTFGRRRGVWSKFDIWFRKLGIAQKLSGKGVAHLKQKRGINLLKLWERK